MAKHRDRPTCHGRSMLPIVYGMPDTDLVEHAQRGEVKLGGCCIFEEMPAFACAVCGRTEGRIDDIDEHMADDDWG